MSQSFFLADFHFYFDNWLFIHLWIITFSSITILLIARILLFVLKFYLLKKLMHALSDIFKCFSFFICRFMRHIFKERIIFWNDFINELFLFVWFALRLFHIYSGYVILIEESVLQIHYNRHADNHSIKISNVSFIESQFKIMRH